VVRVPGYTTEMYCASCEVRTEFIYVMWKKDGDGLEYLHRSPAISTGKHNLWIGALKGQSPLVSKFVSAEPKQRSSACAMWMLLSLCWKSLVHSQFAADDKFNDGRK
jgi:hypothetical protein